MTKILVIEDEQVVGEMISMYLTDEDFSVCRVETGSAGFASLNSFRPDVVLLDLGLPDWDGIHWCEQVRQSSDIPIIVISTKTKVGERIEALNIGADDYLVKPFSMQELKARIGVALRRAKPAVLSVADTRVVRDEITNQSRAPIRIDLNKRQILVLDEPVDMTFTEFEIMKLFFEHPGRVFTRDDLLNTVRGIDSFVNDRAIDVHITNLRRKLEINPKEPQFIKTVWGVGYKLVI